ncbi:signal transduction histidine kinase [Bradyrhizobium sp. USDA 377]
MAIFLILAPYGAFTFLMLVTSTKISVLAASAICLATVAIDVARGRSVKTLAAGSAIVFAAIGLYLTLIDPALGTLGVKLSVDVGIFVISLGSMLLRHPFTLQYALESVPAETAAMPGFLTANYVITGAWTVAALLMAAANLVLLYVPGLPLWSSLAVAFAARNSAIYFTKWYPEYRQIKYGTPARALPDAR